MSDPFKFLKGLDALTRLAADHEKLLRQAQPLLDAARRAEESMQPLQDSVSRYEDLGRRLASSLEVNTSALALAADNAAVIDRLTPGISPGVIEKLSGQHDFAQPLVEAIERAIPKLPQIGISPGLQDVLDRLSGTAIAPQLAAALEPPAGLAALLRASSAIESSFTMPALHEAQRVAKSFAAAMPDVSAFDSNRLGCLFTERFARRAETMAADDAETDDALADLAGDVEEAFATAKTDEERVFTRVFVLQQLIGLAIQFGPAVAVKLWPLITVLLLTVPVPPLPAPPPRQLPAALGAPSAGSSALALPGGWQIEGLPEIIRRAGPQAERRTIEFFTANIRNPNTRQAYAHAVMRFMNWCEDRNLELIDIAPFAVAAYIEEMQGGYAAPTVKQHLAAIRMLFDYLVVGQVLPMNPASSVRGPKHVVKKGKTPVLQPDEVRLLLNSIDVSELAGLRDRALLGVMVYSFARVSAVLGMDVKDYYQQGKSWWLRLHEKGGKYHEVPVHHKAEEYLDAYVVAAGLKAEGDSPLWRSMTKKRGYSGRSMSRVDVFRMIKRRGRDAELGERANCHTFRATGITAYLLNGGTLERAQAIAAHESPRTTKLYGRTSDEITVADIERIEI